MSLSIEVTQEDNTSCIELIQHTGDVDAFKEEVCQEFGLDPQEHEQDVEELFDSIKDGLLFEDEDNNTIDFSEIEMFLEHSFNDDTEAEAFWLYAQHTGNGTSDKTDFQNAYQGTHESEEDFAEHLAKSSGWITEDTHSVILNCIDFDRLWCELSSQDYFAIDMPCGVAVFRNV